MSDKQLLVYYLNKKVTVITADGRNLVGKLKGFDNKINLILKDTQERIFSEKESLKEVSVGLMLIKGGDVVCLGEIDETKDFKDSNNNIKDNVFAKPLKPVVHTAF